MPETPRVHFESLPPVEVWVPGPRAGKAACILDRIRDAAREARGMLRYADDADTDPAALEAVEDALRIATRAARHGFSDHNRATAAEWRAQQFADAIGTDMETPDDETSSELDP